MGTGPRNKARGYEHEAEIVKLAQEAGLEAVRAWGSNGRAIGQEANVDLTIAGQPVQAKRKKRLPKYLAELTEDLDNNVAVVFREDRGENYAVVRLEWVLQALRVLTAPGDKS